MDRHLIRLAAAVSLSVVFASAALAQSRVTQIRWEPGGPSGGRRLVVEVDPPVKGVEVVTSSRGVELHLPETTRVAELPDGLSESVSSGGLVLIWPAPRGVVQSVRASSSTVAVTVVEGASAAGTSYRIGVGDLLYVTVYKNQDLTSEYTVLPEGTIRLPLVGDLPAAGWTENDLAARLTDILAASFLVDPQVSVTVRTYQSQFVYVNGAVSQSRRIPLRPGLTMKGVLAEAGVALAPGQQLTLKPSGASGAAQTLGENDLDAESAPLPKDGDVVTVMERPSVLIQGEVRRAGRFPLEPGMTLLEALALAEGTTEWAHRSDLRIRRKAGGSPTEIRANLKRIEDRKDPDPVLRPGDMIIVRRRTL